MLKFTSLSHRLFFGYIAAIFCLTLHIIILGQIPDITMTGKIFASVVVISLVFLVLHLFFYRNFLLPVYDLIHVIREHANTTNSQQRAKKRNDDELGILVDTLNEMINQIQLREELIISERDRVAIALEQADEYAALTQQANKKLEFEVQVRKGIEAKLTGFQQFLNSIINSNPSALIAIDQSLTITQWNQEATNLSGTPANHAVGANINAAFPMIADHIQWIDEVWETPETRTLHNIALDIEGHIRNFEFVIYPLKNTPEPSAVLRVDDITEKLKMEEAIVQSEKVLSLGGMAAGMAHEINNPISAIVQNVQNIQRRIKPNLAVNQEQAALSEINLEHLNDYLEKRKILSFLQNISQSGLRASQLVSNMLQFSRGNELSLVPCPIGEIMEKAIDIAVTDDHLHDFRGNFELNIDQDFKAPEAEVNGVLTEIEQVLLNLIKNSAYAIKERKLTLNDIDEGIINIHQHVTSTECVIIVSDNGIGMDSSTRKHVFEPFFTTKDVGAGTGLGMSVSYFIITSHHKGKMHVESEFGVGTSFEITLPLHQKD